MSVEFTSLTITGHGGLPVPNQFLRQRGETSTLAVLLPGQGYTADMPLFYYSELIALERGWDVLRVDYHYPALAYDDDPEVRKQRLEERIRELHADVDAALDLGVKQRSYETVVLIGKSLGTRAMVHLLSKDDIQDVWTVWLTPLINEVAVRAQVERYPGRSFLAIGTGDFAFDGEYLERLEKQGAFDAVVVEGADHSLHTDDIAGSIRALGEVVMRLDAFLPKGSEGTIG